MVSEKERERERVRVTGELETWGERRGKEKG